MSEAEVLFSSEHVWLKPKGDTAILGMTNFAQKELGDIIFVDLPDTGTRLAKGQVLCSLDSVCYFHQFHIPVSGEVATVNENINDNPDIINTSPVDEGWLVEIVLYNVEELKKLMNASQYEEYIREQPVLQDKVQIRREG
jgi:glycine cleavage system H protein